MKLRLPKMVSKEVSEAFESLDKASREAVLELVDTVDDLDTVEHETLLDMEHGRAGIE
jgi:hypothetical protein